jgi:predicted N-formylglutamate amidohydrolase
MTGGYGLVVSCEHASDAIPARYKRLFEKRQRLLATHRGYDLGAWQLGSALARHFGAQWVCGTSSRLLVDLNRSPHHPALFSEFTRGLPEAERQIILRRVYFPYREAVDRALERELERNGKVLHLSVHSFTPVLRGEVRNAELGLLYDPGRQYERQFCLELKRAVTTAAPALRVRCNYPYRGTADGVTTACRRKHSGEAYLGVELELNQRMLRTPQGRKRIERVLLGALQELLGARA